MAHVHKPSIPTRPGYLNNICRCGKVLPPTRPHPDIECLEHHVPGCPGRAGGDHEPKVKRGLLEWQIADLFGQVAMRRHWFGLHKPWWAK